MMTPPKCRTESTPSGLPYLAAVLTLATLLAGCVKEEYDTPSPVPGDPVVTGSAITVDSLLRWFQPGQTRRIDADVYVETIVIADDRSGNFYKEIVLQDNTAGISVLLDLADYYTDFPAGRKVFVKCKGLYIGDYNGLIQLGGWVEADGSLARIPALLIGNFLLPGSYYHAVTPLTLRPADLNPGNYRQYVNRLVRLDSAEFDAPDTTYADGTLKLDRNLTVNTCQAGSIVLRTSGYASFANDNVPDGNGTLTAVLQIYDSNGSWALSDMQLRIRGTDDVPLVNPRCGAAPPGGFTGLSEAFDGATDNTDLALPGWLNLAVQGSRYWRGGSFSGNKYGQATAFGSGLPAMETWLITPELNLAVADTLTFESAQAFWVHDGLSAWISTDFNGSAAGFAAATWTPLPATFAGQGNSNYDWVTSGSVTLTGFSGSGYIGFRYEGDGTTNTTTFRLDNIAVH